MDHKQRVLFICVHNTGRSQIAEAFLKKLGGERFQVESAGLEAGAAINPLVVAVMKEEGIDLSGKTTQSVIDLFKQGRLYDYVVAVCDGASEAKCPVFPGVVKRLHWPFPDPAGVTGSEEEKLEAVRKIREMIKERLVQDLSL